MWGNRYGLLPENLDNSCPLSRQLGLSLVVSQQQQEWCLNFKVTRAIVSQFSVADLDPSGSETCRSNPVFTIYFEFRKQATDK